MDEMNLTLPAIAVREFHLKTGFADYLLFVDGQAIGAVEAKKTGTKLIGVEPQSKKYSEGLPDFMQSWATSPPRSPPEAYRYT
jgi:type I restriction enzyme R subunit